MYDETGFEKYGKKVGNKHQAEQWSYRNRNGNISCGAALVFLVLAFLGLCALLAVIGTIAGPRTTAYTPASVPVSRPTSVPVSIPARVYDDGEYASAYIAATREIYGLSVRGVKTAADLDNFNALWYDTWRRLRIVDDEVLHDSRTSTRLQGYAEGMEAMAPRCITWQTSADTDHCGALVGAVYAASKYYQGNGHWKDDEN